MNFWQFRQQIEENLPWWADFVFPAAAVICLIAVLIGTKIEKFLWGRKRGKNGKM